MSENKFLENWRSYAELIALVIGGIYALVKLSFPIFGITVIFIVVSSIIVFYPWKAAHKEEETDTSYKRFTNAMRLAKRIILIISLIIPSICIILYEVNKGLPEWQQEYIKSQFIKEELVTDLEPIKLPTDSLSVHKALRGKNPILIVKHSSTLYFYDNKQVTNKIIERSVGSFNNSFALPFAFLILIFSILFIFIDLVGSVRQTT